MKSSKINFDLTDRRELVELLRRRAADAGTTQKEVLIKALDAYFANEQESMLLETAASRSFAEWNNPEDAIYDKI